MHEAHDGPLPAWLAAVARAPEWMYGAAVAWRNRRFDLGQGVRRLPVPVISVGNLVAGGTGKSPVTRWVARWAIEAGRHPLIAMRGYGSRAGVSDEAEEHRRELPGVPLAVGPDRHAQILRALDSHPACDLAILDDGFQHRQLARDFDLVLINGATPALAGGLLPRGWLREPPASLRRADAVLVTKLATPSSPLSRAIEAVHGRPPIAWCDSGWEQLGLMSCGASQAMEFVACEWLAGRRVAVWAGVVHGEDVVNEATAHGAEIASAPRLRDHVAFDATMVKELARRARREGADAILVTGKDWSKLSPLASIAGLPIVVPRLEIRMHTGADELREALGRAIVQR